MKLQHGHTYRTRCGWVGKAETWLYAPEKFILRDGEGACWLYKDSGLFVSAEDDPNYRLHIISEVTTDSSARASLIESLRGIALAWHEPLAKANMIAMLEIIDELKKELETA